MRLFHVKQLHQALGRTYESKVNSPLKWGLESKTAVSRETQELDDAENSDLNMLGRSKSGTQ
jgi:hypothetical protein